MPAPDVLEPVATGHADRDLWIVTAGLALALAAIAATFVFLPRIFGILVLVVVVYPALQVVRRLARADHAAAPRIRLDDDAIDFGGVLRYRWRDVAEVGVGTLARRSGRSGAARVKLRLNRLAPIRPTSAALRSVGLDPGDGYFDLAIPPAYELTPDELAARIEERRTAAASR